MSKKEEEQTCGGCDRIATNCYCRIVECSKCGDMNKRFNMKHFDEGQCDFYDRCKEDQDEGALCKDCFYGCDSDSDDSEYMPSENTDETKEFDADDY